MTGLPLAVVQQRLDAAYLLHPESQTLTDFRADVWLVEAEGEAVDAVLQAQTYADGNVSPQIIAAKLIRELATTLK